MRHRSLAIAASVLVIASACLVTELQAAEKAKALFNGKDLSGWDGNPQIWSAEDGAIVGRTTSEVPLKKNTFLIWRDGELRDFRLKLKYRIDGGNSGVQYRAEVLDPAIWSVGGYQADIDSANNYTGILYEEQGRGILTLRGQKVTIAADGEKKAETFATADELKKAIHADDWNEYVIEVRGERLRHYINGKLMSETVDAQRGKRADKGILALQVHTGPPMVVRFREIELETLDANSPDYTPETTDGKE